MSRRRYLSTEISLDKRVNKLAIEYGDFAVMLYTWMIPHAGDDATITGDPEELMFMVIPGRRDKTDKDVSAALQGMHELGLIHWDREQMIIYFPTSSFYKYQTYIKTSNRRNEQVTAENSEENNQQRKTPKNTVSPPLTHSPSLSHSSSGSDIREREGKLFAQFEESFIDPNPIQREKLSSYLDDGMEPEVISKAITITKLNGKDINYLWGVLNRLLERGIKTIQQYEESERVRKSSIKQRGDPKVIIPQSFQQSRSKTPQKTVSDEELEALLAEMKSG